MRSLSSDIFTVVQADTTDSEVAGSTLEEHRYRRIDARASATRRPIPNPQRNGLIHNLRFRTIHDGLLPLGRLSILRQEENGFFAQDRIPSRENTCCARKPEATLDCVEKPTAKDMAERMMFGSLVCQAKA